MPKILSSVLQHGRTYVPENEVDEAQLPAAITQKDADRLIEEEVLEEGFTGNYDPENPEPPEGAPKEEHRPKGTIKDEDGEPIPDKPAEGEEKPAQTPKTKTAAPPAPARAGQPAWKKPE
jgi:hypothetical protein